MPNTKSPASPGKSNRLYLAVDTAEGALQRLQAALVAAPAAAAVLLKSRGGGHADIAEIRPLVEAAQSKGAAVLLEDDARLARTLRADGVHLSWTIDIVERYAEARDILGTRYIVGASAGASRHDALTLGEAGADYVGFGLAADLPEADAQDDRLDLIDWWAEIIEVPCVALDIVSTAEATQVLNAGADFVALCLPAGSSPAASAEFAREVHQIKPDRALGKALSEGRG